MAIDPARALGYETPEVEGGWNEDDVILYHVGLGAGDPPTEPHELAYVYEKKLVVLPSFAPIATVGALAGLAAVPGLELDPLRMVHGEQRVTIHGRLPPSCRVLHRARVAEIWDKSKACVVAFDVATREKESGKPVFVNRFTLFIRGAGGFGGDPGPRTGAPPPDRDPDGVIERSTLPQQAAIYRLNGDRNPLHIDPDFARAAGFERPPLHGLCTYGIACKALVDELLGGAVDRVADYAARFSAVLYPGETLSIPYWLDEGEIRFEARAWERATSVLTAGVLALGRT